jgi:hypothetical protein
MLLITTNITILNELTRSIPRHAEGFNRLNALIYVRIRGGGHKLTCYLTPECSYLYWREWVEGLIPG